MVSWSLLTAHTTSALQFMRGHITVNEDPWHQRKTQNIHIVFVQILFSRNTNNLVRKTKSGQEVLLKFLQGTREGSKVEKVKLRIFVCLTSFVILKYQTLVTFFDNMNLLTCIKCIKSFVILTTKYTSSLKIDLSFSQTRTLAGRWDSS